MSSFTRNEIVILVVTSLGHAVCHLGELLFPAVLLAVKDEFGLEPDQATLLVLLGYVLMGAGALPVGLWADAGDPWRIHCWFFLAMALGCGAVALADTPVALFAALTLLGVATSIYHPTGLAMLSLGVRRGNLAMGINGVAGSIGIASAPLVGHVAQALGGWRLAYWGVCALAAWAALAMLCLWKYRFQLPQRTPLVDSIETRDGKPLGFPWLLIGVMMLGGLNYRCLVTTLPPFLNDRAGPEFAGLAASLILLAGTAGQLLSGKLGDIVGCRPIYLTMVLCLVPLGLLLASVRGAGATVLLGAAYSICLFGQQPVENTLLAQNTSIRRRSLSYGIKFILTFGVGALGAQVVGSYWRSFGSLDGMFYILAGSTALMGTLLALWLRHHRPSFGREAPPSETAAPQPVAAPLANR